MESDLAGAVFHPDTPRLPNPYELHLEQRVSELWQRLDALSAAVVEWADEPLPDGSSPSENRWHRDLEKRVVSLARLAREGLAAQSNTSSDERGSDA